HQRGGGTHTEHHPPAGEHGGEERRRGAEPDVVRSGTVGNLQRGHEREQHGGRADPGAASWAQRTTTREEGWHLHGYADSMPDLGRLPPPLDPMTDEEMSGRMVLGDHAATHRARSIKQESA